MPEPETAAGFLHDTADFGTVRVVHRACPMCGRDNRAHPPSRYSDGIWEVKSCVRCRFVYIEKSPVYEALFSDMAWERTATVEMRRRAEIRPVSYRASRATRARMRILPRKKMHLMVAAYAAPGNVVDLGCGNGGRLDLLDDRFVPFGVEISSELARAANALFESRGGRAINAPSIEGLKAFPAGFFTAATLRSYLEHEMKPAEVLRALHRTLAPGGVAIVKVPNFACLNRMVMGRRWCGFRYPDHLNYFTPASLRDMAQSCGFTVRSGPAWRLPTSDNMYAILTRTDGERGA